MVTHLTIKPSEQYKNIYGNYFRLRFGLIFQTIVLVCLFVLELADLIYMCRYYLDDIFNMKNFLEIP